MSLWRQTGIKPDVLNGPEFPDLCAHIWRDFLNLNKSRRMGFSGPDPITFQDVFAWQAVTGNILHPWEVSAIMAIDEAFMASLNDKESFDG